VSELLTGIHERRAANAQEALRLLAVAPGSDTETRCSLYSMAVRSLDDPSVLERWIELAATEPDILLREQMVARLARVDRRRLVETAGYLDLMIACVEDAILRPHALEALGGLAATRPEAVEALVQAYAGQTSAEAERQILLGVCRLHDLPGGLAGFLTAEVDHCDADVKPVIVDRLLRAGAAAPEALARWLAPGEPSDVRERVLEHLLDRSLPMERAVAGVLATEAQPAIRLLAVRVLAGLSPRSPQAVAALLDAVRGDADDRVRAGAVAAFQHSVDPVPEVVEALLAALRVERSPAVAASLLDLLVPLASRMPRVRDSLLLLAGENLRSDVAAALNAQLGRLLRWDAELLPHFVRAYRDAGDDHLRAALLEALASYPDQDQSLVELYQDALAAPAAGIRRWGVTGLLRVPMTEDRVGAMASGVDSLLDPSIDVGLRRALARKIARVPDPSPELRAALERVATHADDEGIRSACRQALARPESTPPGEEGAASGDLERWYQQVEVERSVEGVFPAVFAAYDADPARCIQIIRAALLDPTCRERLRQGAFRVEDLQVVEYLVSRDALDDDCCRYCVEQALTSSTPSGFVAALRSRPSLPGLPDAAWRILEEARYPHELNHSLLLELLVLGSGGQGAAAEALRGRIAQLSSPAAALPYARLLDSVRSWPAVKPAVEELLGLPALLDSTVLEVLGDSIRELLPGWTPATSAPGLADD
jgi:hypothetical protein